MKFNTPSSDSCVFSATLPNVSAFSPAGTQLVVDVGGFVSLFTLDNRGKSVNANGSVLLRLNPSVRDSGTRSITFTGGEVPIRVRLRGNLAGEWRNEGVDPSADARKISIIMPVSVQLNGVNYSNIITTSYSAKAARTGRLKF